MSRHRNVRSMNYSEECEGFDDVYGHSVEDDYCVSPSVAEQFIYDRSRRPQMSAFLGQEEEIAEEDEEEGEEEGGEEHHHGMPKCAMVGGMKGLSDLDHARLQSCLEEVRNVIGDSIAEQTVIKAVLSSDFNVEKALNMVLNNATEADTSGALKTVKADQRKEKDVCSNCNSYSSPRGSSNACTISNCEGLSVMTLTGSGVCGSGVSQAGSDDSSAQDVVVEPESHGFTPHPSEPPPSEHPSSPHTSEVREGDDGSGCRSETNITSGLDDHRLEQVTHLHPPSDSEDEDDFPSLCSLVIHNTSAHGGVSREEEGRKEGIEKEKQPSTSKWSPNAGVDIQVGTGDDSEDSDEYSSLCSLVVHNRSEKRPMPPKTLAPFAVPALIPLQKTTVDPKIEGRPGAQCSSDPSSEEEDDDFSSLHSLVIRNRSAPLEAETSGVHCGKVPSLGTRPRAIGGSCAGDVDLVCEEMEAKESDSEEEDNYSSLCSLVIHNRSAPSEGLESPGGVALCQKTAQVMHGGELGGSGCVQEEVESGHSGSFVIPPLLVVPKHLGGAFVMGAPAQMGSESSEEEEEEEDYMIDLCGTLKSMDVESISSAGDSESQDELTDVKSQPEVEDSEKKEVKWKIMDEGWARAAVEGMRLLDMNSRKLSSFGRVLCKNFECLKQVECPRKRDSIIGLGTFLFDKESPDDICRRLRAQKYLVQVNAAKVTS